MKIRLCTLIASLTLFGCQATKQPDYNALLLPSPRSPVQGSIVHSGFTANPLVRNGKAYEMVRLTLPPEITHVAVPPGTKVFRSGDNECR